jgi:arylsulfatase
VYDKGGVDAYINESNNVFLVFICMARPNFLIIVADDLGYSDISPYGSEIATPNLESLASEGGTLFTDFHTASACSPTRAMLLSGTDNHLAGIGQMLEAMMFHTGIWDGKPGYEGYLNDRVAALPEILKDIGGYRTIMSGKWHLGLTEERFPSKRGFEKSFTLLPGGGSHFNYEPGTAAKPALPFLPPLYARDDHYISYTTLPEDYYSSDYFTSELIKFLDTDDQHPFFAYLPFTAPHWPLQAPDELIKKYKGRYDMGPDVLRAARLEGQRRLDLLSPDVTVAPVTTDQKAWNLMSTEEQMFSAKTMEIYAAMVERMDYNIGRIVDYLRRTNQFDNTFILFMSDNGAEGAVLEALPLELLDGMHTYYDNSYANIGSKSSFIWYGPRWAQAATAPSRMTKGYITEGGIRCPAIVHYSPWTTRKVTHEFCTVMDILPTVLELAGVAHPGTTFQGRKVLLPRGKSWVSHFLSNQSIHDEHQDFTGWELFGQRAIRRGNYKAVYFPKGPYPEETKWELYDLTQDKGELKDLAEEKPELLKELIELWVRYENETGVIVAPDPYKLSYNRFIIDAE